MVSEGRETVPERQYGIVGDIRTFAYEGVDWRVCAYRVPENPTAAPRLLFVSQGMWFDAERFPADWERLAPADLIGLTRGLTPRPVRRSTPPLGVNTQTG